MRGNPHAAFDVAGAGNVAWSKWCDTRRRKGEPTGNTNIDLNRRVSPRPYRGAPVSLSIYTRSTESIIYFLEEVVRRYRFAETNPAVEGAGRILQVKIKKSLLYRHYRSTSMLGTRRGKNATIQMLQSLCA